MGNWLTWLDIKLAFRLLRKRPLLELTALFSLAVGIAVAVIGTTVLDAFTYSDLPFPGGDRFLRVRARIWGLDAQKSSEPWPRFPASPVWAQPTRCRERAPTRCVSSGRVSTPAPAPAPAPTSSAFPESRSLRASWMRWVRNP